MLVALTEPIHSMRSYHLRFLPRFPQAKYSGESVGVKLNPVPEGPFFKAVSKSGYAKDMSSAATLLEKKR